MSRNSKQKREIAYRQKLVADYITRGIENRDQIADLLASEHNIITSGRTIGDDKIAIEARWLEESKALVDNRKANLEARYQRIYSEAFSAWFRSLQDAETTIQEMIDAGEPVKLDKDGKPM